MAIETIKEFARRHNVSKQSVMNWKRAGYVKSTEGGHIDGAASDELLAQRAPVYRGGETVASKRNNGNGHNDHGSMAETLLRKESALAELRELQLDRESGRVVLVEDAVRILAGTMALVRAHLLRLGAVISTRAASCATPAALKAMIDAEVAEVMAALYGYDGELDLGEPSKKAERLIRRKYLRRR